MTTTFKISKIEVMSRAHRIYKSGLYSKSWADCLSRAWSVERANLEKLKKEAYLRGEVVEGYETAKCKVRNLGMFLNVPTYMGCKYTGD